MAFHRQIGYRAGISLTLCNLGATVYEEGDLEAARVCYRDALTHLSALGNTLDVSLALDGLGAVAGKWSEWTRAGQLAGAAEALREAIGSELEPADRAMRERYVGEARDVLGAAGLEAALAEGTALTLEQAIAYALSE